MSNRSDMADSTIFIDLDRTGQWFVFCSPYNESFIFELKAKIAPKFRRWRNEEKAWCVAREKWPIAETLMRKHYGQAITIEVGPAAEAAQIDVMVGEVHEPTADDYMKIGVRADAPHCVLHAAYHALEALWSHGDREEIRLLGVYPIEEIRGAYHRACMLRGIPEDPSAFRRAPEGADANTTPPVQPRREEPRREEPRREEPPPSDDYYQGPSLDAYARPQPMQFIDFIDEGNGK